MSINREVNFLKRGGNPPFLLVFSIALLAITLMLMPVRAKALQMERMEVVGVFDPGQPSALIIKMYDKGADIYCYMLMPANAVKHELNGVITYDGNNIGSISCVQSNRPLQLNIDKYDIEKYKK